MLVSDRRFGVGFRLLMSQCSLHGPQSRALGGSIGMLNFLVRPKKVIRGPIGG